jgi:RimJ/RimL family protein N-acetyltransferase
LTRDLRFRALQPDDLRLVHEWLQRPHVRRWWSDQETYEEVCEHYLPSIDGEEPTDHYIVFLDEQPVGFIETYLVSDHPDYAALVGVGEGVAGVDLFIGDVGLIGQGLGTEIIRRFVEEIVFASPATTGCIAGPDARNAASIRAFEKAGFRLVKQFVEDGEPHTLVRRDR